MNLLYGKLMETGRMIEKYIFLYFGFVGILYTIAIILTLLIIGISQLIYFYKHRRWMP